MTSPVRVGGDVREPKLVKVISPKYPKAALIARVEGVVVLEATVTVNGTVEDIRAISGPPILVNAAKDAVKQWRYEPTLLNGVPISVILTAKLSFFLDSTS